MRLHQTDLAIWELDDRGAAISWRDPSRPDPAAHFLWQLAVLLLGHEPERVTLQYLDGSLGAPNAPTLAVLFRDTPWWGSFEGSLIADGRRMLDLRFEPCERNTIVWNVRESCALSPIVDEAIVRLRSTGIRIETDWENRS